MRPTGRSALLQQVAEAAVGVGGSGVTGVLAHGPDAAAIDVRLHAAGVGKLTGEADVFPETVAAMFHIFRTIERLDGQPAVGLERLPALRVAGYRRLESFLLPLFLASAGHVALLVCNGRLKETRRSV